MGAITMLFLTFFAAVITGSVILIQVGGWLQILAAILIIIHFFISTSLLVILIEGTRLEKKRIKKEEDRK